MAIVKKYPAEVVGLEQRAPALYTITFRSLSSPFRFSPGQFLHLALDPFDPVTGWPESRCFSMMSPPSDDLLRLTFTARGGYTRRMAAELKPGMQVTLKLPYGSLFTQHHEKADTVFLSGGTGITPFLSLFNEQSFEHYHRPKLFAGFRDSTQHIYHEELSKSMKINPEFQTFICYEDVDGYISLNTVLSELKAHSVIFLAGPPSMISSFKQGLLSEGVPLSQIRTDEWE